MRVAPHSVVWPALLLQAVGTFFCLVAFGGTMTSQWIYALLKISMVVLPFIVLFTWGEPPTLVIRRRRRLRGVIEGLVCGVLMAGAMLALIFGPMELLLTSSKSRIVANLRQSGMADNYLLFGLAIAFLHSAVEECYWRYFLYGQLVARFAERKAHLITGFGFALHHMVLAYAYCGLSIGLVLGTIVGVAGMFWSWLYQRNGTLWSPWVAHVCADLAIICFGFMALS